MKKISLFVAPMVLVLLAVLSPWQHGYVPATDAASSSQLVVSSPLKLDRTTVAMGGKVSGSVTYKNSGTSPINVRDLVIAARTPRGDHRDFSPGTGWRTIRPGETLSLTAARQIWTNDTVGAWTVYSSWRDTNGTWWRATPVTLTVTSSTTEAPPSTATATKAPSPIATAAKSPSPGATPTAVSQATPTRTLTPTAQPTLLTTGTAYYVAPGGSDANSGTLAAPLASVQAGLGKLNAGDTLFLRGGVYSPSTTAVLSRSGAAGRPITVRGYPGETAVIDGGFRLTVGLEVRAQSWVVLEGFTVRRVGTGKGHAGVKLTGAADVTVRDLTVTDHRDIGLLIDSTSQRVNVLGGRYSLSTTGIYINGHQVLIDGVASFDNNRMIDNGEDCDGDSTYGEHGGQAITVADTNGPVEVRNSEGWNNKASSICYGSDGAFVELFRSQNVNVHHNRSRDGIVFAEAAGDTSGIRLWRNEVINEQFLATHQANDLQVVHNTVSNTLSASYTNPIIWLGSGGTFGNGSTAGFVFVNNIIQTPGLVWQVLRSLDASATVDHNLYRSGGLLGIWTGSEVRTLADWQARSGRDRNSLAADPLFVNAAGSDFHLAAGSPAIDRGTVAGLSGSYTGVAPNIGRWE